MADKEREEKEVGKKNIILETQSGFRKGRLTMDNIFVPNHLIQKNKQTEDKERKVYALFTDLKAAIDRVDRGIL